MDRLRYAVFGHPVAHSRSPAIHAAFAAQCGIALEYVRIDAAPEDFAAALARFAAAGGRGANVTLPHKGAASALCSTRSARAGRAGAVNTLVRLDAEADGAVRWHGDNTDGIGLVRDLRDRHGLVLAGARVLLLGAGGAAAGIAPALLDAGIARLSIANRDASRGSALAAQLADPRACAVPMAARAAAAAAGAADMRDAVANTGAYDIVINATAAARSGAAPWERLCDVLGTGAVAVDLGYGEAAAPFLQFARANGASGLIDGLGMLVEQAAESFRLWHGVRPDTDPVLAGLRAGTDA